MFISNKDLLTVRTFDRLGQSSGDAGENENLA